MKNKSYIGISFIILIFGIYAVPKIIDKLNGNNLVVIGAAPKFELIDQNNKKITDATFVGDNVNIFFIAC